MFGFFRKRPGPLGDVDKQVAQSLIAYILHDSDLSRPVYLKDAKSEIDVENIGLGPLVMVWNEDVLRGSFSVSINKKTVEHLLEGAMTSDHKNFIATRNEVINTLSKSVPPAVVKACEGAGVPASVLFSLH